MRICARCIRLWSARQNDVAVRVWSQPYSEDEVVTASGKAFKLINLPFYMVGGLESLVVGK